MVRISGIPKIPVSIFGYARNYSGNIGYGTDPTSLARITGYLLDKRFSKIG